VPSAAPLVPADATVGLHLTFESVDGPLTDSATVTDESGNGNDGVVRTENADGPALTAGPVDGEAHAVTFTSPCDDGAACPKVVIEVPDAAAFRPGDGPLRWGARVLLAPSQTSKGSNIVQKGFSTGGGSQWKLQVDGTEGLPTCTVVGLGSDEIHVAKSARTVADSQWHDVTCVRGATSLEIIVDGVTEGSAPLPGGLEIAPEGPVRIGGKNVKPDNDQFFGGLAAVFVGS
jgi:hypothetical protein